MYEVSLTANRIAVTPGESYTCLALLRVRSSRVEMRMPAYHGINKTDAEANDVHKVQ